MCVLHLYSRTKSFKEFAASTRLPVYSVHDIGEMITRRRTAQEHTMSVAVSEKEWDDFQGQVGDAIALLTTHFDELKSVMTSHAIEDAHLDFPIETRLGDAVVVQVDWLSKELVRLAGALGLRIGMSQYPATTPKDPVLDWLYMRRDVDPLSLYPTLHDGQWLASSSFDLQSRVFALHASVPHVAAHNQLPSGTAWRLTLRDVDSLRIAIFHELPGDKAPGKHNGVEVSVSWEELASRIAASRAEIYNAELVVDEGAALHLELGIDKPYAYAQLWARGASFAIEDDRGNELTIDAFVALGRAYWEAWAARNKPS